MNYRERNNYSGLGPKGFENRHDLSSSKFHGYHRMLCEAGTARNPMSCILAERSKVKGERRGSFEL